MRAFLLALFGLTASAPAQCLEFDPRFAPAGIQGRVFALAWFDDGLGAGPRLFAGGNFSAAGPALVENLAVWNGANWEGLPGGNVSGPVLSFAVHDDGSGPALYIGGDYQGVAGQVHRSIVRWDGSAFSAVGTGVNRAIRALASCDLGAGPVLVAGGTFDATPQGAPLHRVAAWDGSTWTNLGAGITADVRALALHDDGGGAVLHVGGGAFVHRWNGSGWSALNSAGLPDVYALASFGGALHAGGAATLQPSALVRWTGAAWQPVGAGIVGTVQALLPFDDGGMPALAIGGQFAAAGGVSAAHVARWDGTAFAALGAGFDARVGALAAGGSIPGARLTSGGDFLTSGSTSTPAIASYDGAAWSVIGTGEGAGPTVDAFEVFDDGSGRALYAGGRSQVFGPAAARGVARWTGTTWAALGSGLPNGAQCYDLALHDDGSGTALYVAGFFASAGGVATRGIARWDGVAWSGLAGGLSSPPPFTNGGSIYAVASYDGGSGPELFVSGSFDSIGGLPIQNVARWNGSTWLPAGTMGFATYDLEVYDDGSGVGPKLYLASGGVHRWDGGAWTLVGSAAPSTVEALAVFDDGDGPRLVAGGAFSSIGGLTAQRVAAWNGSSWTTLAGGLSGITSITSLEVFDDGSGVGARLHAGLRVTMPGTAPRPGLARWTGAGWSVDPRFFGPGSTSSTSVSALRAFDDGSGAGSQLWTGGLFQSVGGLAASNVTRLQRDAEQPGCEARTGTSFCAGDGSASACPCGNVGGAGRGCENSNATGGALLEARGQAQLESDDVRLVVSGLSPTSTLLYFQGTSATNGGLGATFGDGLRCAGGTVVRLAVRVASAGQSSFGGAGSGDPGLGASSGLPPTGGVRRYQVWYRDAQPYCTPSTWNLSNGLTILWAR